MSTFWFALLCGWVEVTHVCVVYKLVWPVMECAIVMAPAVAP